MTKATLIVSGIAFSVYAALTFIGSAWCTPLLAIVLGLSVGYVGAQLDQLDVAKTARIARNSGKAGLIAGGAAMVGQWLGSWLAFAATDVVLWVVVTNGCLGLITMLVSMVFGGIGGWSWARHEHERQTGYKPT